MDVDPVGVLRGAFHGYLFRAVVFGLVTAAWFLLGIGLRREWIAAVWFAIAGAGTVLAVAVLAWHALSEDDESFP